MTFDKPQWTFKAAPRIEAYAFVTGVVNIYYERGPTKRAPVVVPTEAFTLLRTLLSPEEHARAERSGVQFYFDDLGGGRWAVGFQYDKESVDLWVLTRSTLPPWFELIR